MIQAMVGGIAIGVAAAMVWWQVQRAAGISSIVAGLLRPAPGQVRWRAAFVAGLVFGGTVLGLVVPEQVGSSPRSLGVVLLAGGLVGFGTRLGGGCTSGHGVCGIGAGSFRSLVATGVFVAVGMAVATALHGRLG